MAMLILKVTYHVKSRMVNEFMTMLTDADIEEKVRVEEGCINYYYTSHLENDTVILTECWESKEAQQKHLNQPYMSVVKALKEKYVLSTDVSQETESTFEEE